MPISSYELLSLPNTNMKNGGSGNAPGLKFEPRTGCPIEGQVQTPYFTWAELNANEGEHLHSIRLIWSTASELGLKLANVSRTRH